MNNCPLCERENIKPSNHHLIPKTLGGKKKEIICEDCHKAIHALFTNKELRDTYNSVEILLSDEKLRKTISFIQKQDPNKIIRTKRPKNKRKRGRSG